MQTGSADTTRQWIKSRQVKRFLKAALWVVNYELWRLNVKLTIEYYRQRKELEKDNEE